MNRIRIHVLPSSRGRVTQAARAQEPQTCSYTQRPCSQPRLEGIEFCIKHVLEDKNAPYRQCSYVSNKNGKRCPNAAPKPEKKEGWGVCLLPCLLPTIHNWPIMLFFFFLGYRSVLNMHAEMLWFSKLKCGRHPLQDLPLKSYCLSSVATVGRKLELTVKMAVVKLVAY